MDATISFRDVHIGFGEGDIVNGLSFEVMPRETLVLLGETGTGKTLSLKMAAGLLRPTRGQVDVLDRTVSRMREKDLLDFRREIGFVFQEGALFDSMTVEENVAFRLREEGVPEAEIEPKVREALRFVELEHAIWQLPSELSGGMRRRASIARAIITRPPIVLYDSPTAGLDPVTAQTIIALILRLRDTYGVTALLATHRSQDGFALANFFFDRENNEVRRNSERKARGEAPSQTRFAVLRDGKLFFVGSPEELGKTKDPYLQRFLV
ncbi:MAG TPA: ATP-binding cassette domain-containing protein [Dongiaceae bacterium]|nr:ATP-binding cassette domain-containing protein [Dongiaceae bacterium]